MLEKIIGRIEDIIVTPDGRHVGRLDAAFKYSKGIRLSQIVQEDISNIKVKIVKDSFYNQEDENTLINELRKRLGKEIEININYVDDIPLTKQGKLKFVISKIKNENKS